jgi:hypothetical protein
MWHIHIVVFGNKLKSYLFDHDSRSEQVQSEMPKLKIILTVTSKLLPYGRRHGEWHTFSDQGYIHLSIPSQISSLKRPPTISA